MVIYNTNVIIQESNIEEELGTYKYITLKSKPNSAFTRIQITDKYNSINKMDLHLYIRKRLEINMYEFIEILSW